MHTAAEGRCSTPGPELGGASGVFAVKPSTVCGSSAPRAPPPAPSSCSEQRRSQSDFGFILADIRRIRPGFQKVGGKKKKAEFPSYVNKDRGGLHVKYLYPERTVYTENRPAKKTLFLFSRSQKTKFSPMLFFFYSAVTVTSAEALLTRDEDG